MIKSAQQSSIQNDIKYRSMSAGNVPSNEYFINTWVLDQDATTFEIPNLDAYHGIYKHLKLIMLVRSNRVGADSDRILLSINSSALTKSHRLRGNGTDVASSNWSSGEIAFPTTIKSGENTLVFSPVVVDILDFSSSVKNTTVRALHASTINGTTELFGSFLNSTAAVTTLGFSLYTGPSFDAGSRFSLYGVTA